MYDFPVLGDVLPRYPWCSRDVADVRNVSLFIEERGVSDVPALFVLDVRVVMNSAVLVELLRYSYFGSISVHSVDDVVIVELVRIHL